MAALLIAGKDLRQRLRDRSAILIAIVVPLGLAAVFDLVLSGAASGDTNFEYAVVNEDQGPVGQAFESEILAGIESQGLIELRTADSVDQARRLTADGTIAAAFVIPQGFSDAVVGGRVAELRVIGDVDAPVATQVASSIAKSFADDVTSAGVAVTAVTSLEGGATTPEEVAALGRRAAEIPNPIAVVDRSATSRSLDFSTFFAAGMAVFFLFFTVQYGVSSLLEERTEGTMSRLLAAPIGRWQILAGKLLTSFVLGVISMTILIVATSLLLGATWGNPIGVALLVVAGVLAATGVMALVATFATTADQAGNYQAIIAVVLGALGGAFFPISQAGGVLATLSLLTPHAWFLRGLSDLSGGGGIGVVLPAVGAMLAFAAVTGGIAMLRLGRLARP